MISEQDLYQLIIARLDGDGISNPDYKEWIRYLTQKGIGGFVLFGGEIEEIREFISELQGLSSQPLFICSDIEQGVGQQITGATLFPTNMGVASAIDIEAPEDTLLFDQAIHAIADEALYTGINMPLIPVLDVNTNPDNPIICTRAFSDDPERVAQFGMRYIEMLESRGLLSCAKHFPGHGDTDIDSHVDLPVIRKSRDELFRIDLYPFKKAIESRVSGIMIGHLSLPMIDSIPASLSERIIQDILRIDLGYQGLIVTDALTMDALRDFENKYPQCIQAGVDILLHPEDPETACAELKNALKDGGLDVKKIETALSRIRDIKERLKRHNHIDIDLKKNHEIASRLFERSITLLSCKDEILPLKDSDNLIVIKCVETDEYDPAPFTELTQRIFDIKGDNLQVSGKTAIVAIYTSSSAWKGKARLSRDTIDRINRIIRDASRSIMISFGCPYVLRGIRGADAMIVAYDTGTYSHRAVVKALKGEIEFTGRLPLRIDIG